MPCYVRAFCTAPETPTINTVMRWLRDHCFDFSAHADKPSELDSPAWLQFEFLYKAGKKPIIVECNRDDGARAECAEFIEEVAELEDQPGKTAVVEHLEKTRFIICCQLLSDIDENGYDANSELLAYFVDHCGGMMQADGEGFYDPAMPIDMLLPME
jgi:hypothetical protein